MNAPPLWVRIAAPAIALGYPALIACGTRISPVFLIVALCVPAAGLAAGYALARSSVQLPRARAVAHVVVAAPALFSLLGGWLDFQHAIPVDSTTVWFPL